MSVLGSKIMRQFSDLIEMMIHKEKNSTTMIHKEPTFPDRQAVVDVGGGLQLQGKLLPGEMTHCRRMGGTRTHHTPSSGTFHDMV